MIITKKWLIENRACEEMMDRFDGEPIELSDLIERLDRADWLLWLLWHTESVTVRQMVRLACKCGRMSLRHVPPGEDRPRLAYEAAEAWVVNPTAAARAAAAAAAWAAGSARAAAEGAAAKAAEAAARAAASAEAEAAWAASVAAWAAAEEASAAVARAAAEAAREGSAAKAEHKTMCTTIRRELAEASFKDLAMES